MKSYVLNNGDHILDENKDNKSEIALSDADSEHEEAINEKDVFSNIQLVEVFKDQFYTFVDESEGITEANSYNESFNLRKKSELM